MHVSVVILFTVSISSFVKAGEQLSLIKRPANENDASSKRIFILTGNGPKYLDQKSFKIIPVTTNAMNRRMSRNNDQSGWTFSVKKYPQQESRRRVNEIPVKRKIGSVTTYPQVLRRNENNQPDVASVQRITPFGGMSVLPVSTIQKSNTDSQLRPNNKYIHLNSNVDKNKLSASDQSAQQSESLNGNLSSIHSEPSFVEKLTGWVYPVKNNPFFPIEANNPDPYDFGYGINDGLGSTQFRRESTKGDGVVTGNYGYKDSQGIFRYVNYISDKDGFRTVIRSNEPSVLSVDSADVTIIVDPPPPFSIHQKVKTISTIN